MQQKPSRKLCIGANTALTSGAGILVCLAARRANCYHEKYLGAENTPGAFQGSQRIQRRLPEGATRIYLLSLLPNLQREVSHFTVGCRNGEAYKMHNLRKNIGKAERTGRIIAGVLLFLFPLRRALTVGLTTTAILFGVGGILLLGTSLVGY